MKYSIVNLLFGIKKERYVIPQYDAIGFCWRLRYWTLHGKKWTMRRAWTRSEISNMIVEDADPADLKQIIDDQERHSLETIFGILVKQAKHYKAFSLEEPQ